MRGDELAEVRTAILDAFNLSEFDMFLSDNFDFQRDHEVGSGPFAKIVHDVVQRFDADGAESYLIAALAAAKPLKRSVQNVYRKHSLALINDSWRQRVEAAQLAKLEQYGLLPDLELQDQGKTTASHVPSQGRADGFQRIVNQALPELDAFVWAAQLLKVMRRVCRIEVHRQARGTGFLVAPDLVLSNHHVLRDLIEGRGEGGDLEFLFDYQARPDGTEMSGVRVGAPEPWEDWHVDSSPGLPSDVEHAGAPAPTPDELDHALVRLEHRVGEDAIIPGGPVRGWIHVPRTAPLLGAQMPLAILQHPGARPIKLAFDTRAVRSTNANGTRVRYTTNTDVGASGAPCFDLAWTLLAVHHFGDPEHRPATYNQGVPIAAIAARLARQGKAALVEAESP